MSDVLQSPGFVTWTKGPAALEKLKMALCGLIGSVWENFLNTLSFEEIEHLQQFIEDANDDLIEANKKEKKWIFQCRHSLCQTLLEKLNAIRYNPKSMNIVWNTCCKTGEQRRYSNRHREICNTYYWHVANMFMLHGSERNEIPNTGPEDTDVAMVLKMMKNCTLFEIDDNELYDKVINIRNRIFHSGSYNVSEDEMKSFIYSMIDLLNGVSEMHNCTKMHNQRILSGIKELREIEERNAFLISLTPDWKYIAEKALRMQKEAIKLDISYHYTASLDTDALKSILKTNDDRFQECTNSDEWRQRQKEDERMRGEEEERIKEPLKKIISDLQERLDERNRSISNLEQLLRDRQRQQEDERMRREEEERIKEPLKKIISDLEERLDERNRSISNLEQLLRDRTRNSAPNSDSDEGLGLLGRVGNFIYGMFGFGR